MLLGIGAASVAASAGFAFSRCGGCDDDPLTVLSVDNVLRCQKVSDFLISLAYFSIPLELFYFVTCAAIFPFRWIFLQFGAFIVLCGLTHFATAFTYAPHSFLLMLLLTVLKFLTALVSVATAITLLPLIPQILRVFVREGLLRKKTRDLGREVGLMKRQEAASWHVREITREIRRSLDRPTVLHTALLELSKALFLHNCAAWMADPARPGHLVLRHELEPRRRGHLLPPPDADTVRIDDPEVAQIIGQDRVVFLEQDSRLVCGDGPHLGPAAAIRIPTLRGSSLGGDRGGGGGGGPELVDESNTILVLVLPADGERIWTAHEIEIIEVVADQVAVALSHAAALEETLMMREKLLERNAMLKRAQKEAEMANDARVLFRKVMSREMMSPVRSVAAVLSAMQLETLKPEQVTMVKGGLLLSSLIEDTANVSRLEEGKLELNLRPFGLVPALEEVVSMSKFLCSCRGATLKYTVSGKIPSRAVGDEKRILQGVLYMVAHVLGSGYQGSLLLHIHVEEGSQGAWMQSLYEDFIKLRFEVSRVVSTSSGEFNAATLEAARSDACYQGHSVTICEQLAQLMNGSLSVGSMAQSPQKSMNLLIRLQSQRLDEERLWPRYSYSEDRETTRTLLEGMRILLVDGDVINRSISRKVFEKFGCHLAFASSWYECIENLYLKGSKFHLLLIDLHILNEEGQDISACIRKLYSEGWLITIALASKADKDIQEQCIKTGVHGIIRKPIILQEMVDELSRITQRLQASPAL